MSLIPSLLQAIVHVDGDALVMHAGDKPYVVAPTGQVDLATRGLALDAVNGIISQLLPADLQGALSEFGAVQHELAPIAEFPGEHFTIVAARSGDDVWVEVRRRRNPDDEHAAEDTFTLQDSAAAAPPYPAYTPAPGFSPPVEPMPDSLELDDLVEQGREGVPTDFAAEMPAEGHPVAGAPISSATMTSAEAGARGEARPHGDAQASAPTEIASRDGTQGGTEARDGAEVRDEHERRVGVGVLGETATRSRAQARAEAETRGESTAAGMSETSFRTDAASGNQRPPDRFMGAMTSRRFVESQEAIEKRIADAVVPALALESEAAEAGDVESPLAEEWLSEERVLEPRAEEGRLVGEEPSEAGLAEDWATEMWVTEAQAAEAWVAQAPKEEAQEPGALAAEAPQVASLEPEQVVFPASEAVVLPQAPEPVVLSAQPAVVLPLTRSQIRPEPRPPLGDKAVSDLDRLLRLSAARGASTLYLSPDSRPGVRVDGELQTLEGEPVLTARDVESLLSTLMPERNREALRTGAGTEWILDVEEVGRVRCMSFRDHRGHGGVFRLMSPRSVSVDQLGLPSAVRGLASEPEGLVLVAGPRSSGKRTLISAFVDLINRTRRDHVITIEREINIVHERGSSFISQREVRGNDDDLLAAARAALREDPDVLVIEDLRTAGLMDVAFEASASGHLVVGGFSAPTATGTVERIIDLYPPDHRRQVQLALAGSLRGVVAQALLKKRSGGRVAAREVLLNTPAVSSMIAEGKTSQLPMAIESGRRYGMMPLNDALVSLVQQGVVDGREAYRCASDRHGLQAALKLQGLDTSFAERLV